MKPNLSMPDGHVDGFVFADVVWKEAVRLELSYADMLIAMGLWAANTANGTEVSDAIVLKALQNTVKKLRSELKRGKSRKAAR